MEENNNTRTYKNQVIKRRGGGGDFIMELGQTISSMGNFTKYRYPTVVVSE